MDNAILENNTQNHTCVLIKNFKICLIFLNNIQYNSIVTTFFVNSKKKQAHNVTKAKFFF